MAKMGTSKKKNEQRPIVNRGKTLFELTKTLKKIRAEKELIEKNQFSAVKSDGSPYSFLNTQMSKLLKLGQQEKEVLAEIERLKNESK